MVSSPKHLTDLRRIEAALLVECRGCGGQVRHDPAVLARILIGRGGNLTWSELPRQLPCEACGSADVRVSPVPYAKRGGYHQRVITLALRVLDVAAYSSRTEAVGERPEVRLALRVLLPYVADRAALLAYWERASAPATHPWHTCREPYFAIAKALRDSAWDAPV